MTTNFFQPCMSSPKYCEQHPLSKYQHHQLSFQDQVYLVFRQQQASCLCCEAICDGLRIEFGTVDVTKEHIIRCLRFLHFIDGDDSNNCIYLSNLMTFAHWDWTAKKTIYRADDCTLSTNHMFAIVQ